MAAITVTNTDWTIISGVRSALAGATIAGAAVFEAVTVTTSDRQARGCQFTRHPAAIVRYVTTAEHVSPEDVVGCALDMEVILATRAESAAQDESSSLQEILRLVNAAKNAMEANAPPAASDWADEDFFAADIGFGQPEIDTAERQPWAVARLPVRVTYVLESGTSH
jgi:hypothetical protein